MVNGIINLLCQLNFQTKFLMTKLNSQPDGKPKQIIRSSAKKNCNKSYITKSLNDQIKFYHMENPNRSICYTQEKETVIKDFTVVDKR